MLDSHKIYNALKSAFSAEQADVLTAIISETFLQFDKLVTKEDFAELKAVVRELAEAQRKTEQRLNELAEAQKRTDEKLEQLTLRVNELAEAQRKTEQRLNELAEAQKRTDEKLEQLTLRVNELAEAQRKTEQRLNELAEAQKRTDEKLEQLTLRVNELAEAQRKTEQRLNELAEAQKRTDEKLEQLTLRVNELAEAQRKTEQRLNELAETVQKLTQETAKMRREFSEDIIDIRKNLGGLAMAVGYGIEDRAMPYFYDLAKKDYGVTLSSVDRRNYIYPDGRYDEINIFAEGKKSGKRHLIVAECKAQPSKKDADKFAEMVKRLANDTKAVIHPILVGYAFSPDVEAYVQQGYPELRLMKTYEFEMKYARNAGQADAPRRSKRR